MSPVDLMVTDGGDPVFLGPTRPPRMTETSLLPQAAAAAGLELDAVHRAIVESAL